MTVTAGTTGPTSLIDQLNAEWQHLSGQAPPDACRIPALRRCSSLADALTVISSARRPNPDAADAILLDLLALHQNESDELAGRLVLQAMLGRAVNLVQRAYRQGATGVRGSLPQLSSAAVTGLWAAIAQYPIHRRRRKVSVNLCMDALGHFTTFLKDDAVPVVDTRILETAEPLFAAHAPTAADELLAVVTWGVEAQVISLAEAVLLTQVYCPAPGQEGGSTVVARRLALAPATVRQRCSRAAHRLAAAVRTQEVAEACPA